MREHQRHVLRSIGQALDTRCSRTSPLEVLRSFQHRPQGCRLWRLHGPLGSGKSRAIAQMADLCGQRGIPYVRLDAREAPISTARILETLASLGSRSSGAVLFIDAAERLRQLEAWLLDHLLAERDAPLVVWASRRPPPTSFPRGGACHEAVCNVELVHLGSADATWVLMASGMAADQRDAALRYAEGSPLLLDLAVDVCRSDPNGSFDLAVADARLRLLRTRLGVDATDPSTRAALEALAVVRHLCAESLSIALPDRYRAGAGPLMAWVSSLSFVEDGPLGLSPHPVARRILEAELRANDPERLEQLRQRLGTAFARNILQGFKPDRWIGELAFLYREACTLDPPAWAVGRTSR